MNLAFGLFAGDCLFDLSFLLWWLFITVFILMLLTIELVVIVYILSINLLRKILVMRLLEFFGLWLC